MKIISINISEKQYKAMKILTNKDSKHRKYPSISEFCRSSINKLLIEDFYLSTILNSMENMDNMLTEFDLSKHQKLLNSPIATTYTEIGNIIEFNDGNVIKLKHPLKV